MLMKRFLPAVLTLLFFASTASAEMCIEIADNEKIDANAAIVCEISTGRVLYAYNIDEKLPMASTTKIMTALIALEQPDLDEYFTVDANAIKTEGSSMGLSEGDKVSFRCLLYGMLLPSGNDAANATAVKIGGTTEKFVSMMNERAEEMGLENTHFVTPSGLDDKEHYTTALDLAKLACTAMENPSFCQICKLSNAKVSFGNPPRDRWMKNHNKLLKQDSRCIGVKTGFTDAAGRCLVSAAENSEGEKILVVTLKAVDDWTIHKKFYDKYFAQMHMEDFSKLTNDLKVPIVGGEKDFVRAVAECPLKIPVLKGEEGKVSYKIYLKKFDYAPVCCGDSVGKIEFYIDGNRSFCSYLLADEDVMPVR